MTGKEKGAIKPKKNQKKNMLDKLDDFIQKVDNMKKQDKMDLSSDQDLSIAVMNLISIEEHLIFSGGKTGNTTYYDLVEDIREMRKDLLKKLVTEYSGEEWCISKHLLAGSMRLLEVGTKQLGKGNKKEAYDLFQKSYNLYTLFWGINMKAIEIGDVADKVKNDEESIGGSSASGEGKLFGKLGKLVKKAVDCCLE